jgi:hypothetical protein
MKGFLPSLAEDSKTSAKPPTPTPTKLSGRPSAAPSRVRTSLMGLPMVAALLPA